MAVMEVKGLIHSLSIFLFPFLGDGVGGGESGIEVIFGKLLFQDV